MDWKKKPVAGFASFLICCLLLGPVDAPAEEGMEVAPALTVDEAADTVRDTATDAVRDAATDALTGEKPDASSRDSDKAIEICDIKVIDNAFKAYEKQKSPEQIKRIQLLLRAFGYDPGKIDGRMGKDTDGALLNLCIDYKVDEHLTSDEHSKHDPLKYLVKHMINLLEEPGPIQESRDDCGCSRDLSAMVYGFYPYLLARDEEQNVDFSLFDRIGFNMQVLDKEGGIPGRLQWRDEHESGMNIARFISRAHKHRVKVDVTFYLSDWKNWQDKNISNAVDHIVETASEEFHESGVKLWRTFFPQRIDGINLYFDQYRLPADSARMIDIVENLAEELKAGNAATKLNVILGLDWRGISNRHFEKLKDILVDDEDTIDKVFIFLTKDTSKSKKKLRQIIEDSFHGDERKQVLRKIVPIVKLDEISFEPLPASDKGNSQFDDDLVYFKDNYAGVGLWPLTSPSENDISEVENAIIKHYKADDGLNYIGDKLADYAPGLCEFVCPNRMLFYVVLGFMVSIVAVYALLALWNCRLREIYRRKFIYFIVLILLILLVLVISMVCDPSAERYVDRVVIGILLLVVVGFGWRSIRRAVQPPLP